MRPQFRFMTAALPLLAGLLAVSPGVQAAETAKASPAVVRSAKSGPWSQAATWEGGKVPVAGEKVQVRQGHTVTYDVKSDAVIRSVHLAGSLVFAGDRDTLLNVGLLKIQPGADTSEDGFNCDAHSPELQPGQQRPALEVGTPNHPIDAKHTAVIRLHYIDGMDKESCPAIICCGGRMDLHGAPLNHAWVKLGDTAKKGDTDVKLAENVTGWRVGDKVIVTGTHPLGYKHETETETRTITAITDGKVTLDKALELEHLGTGEYRGEIANLSRNVVIESADPKGVRGHTMYHRNSAGSISYAEFRHLGKEGVLGKYAIHFHLVGDTMRGSYVLGASIWDSKNRWVTIHGTNYLVVRDCVGYQSVGHGFFMEDGTEVYNVLDRNLGVRGMLGKRLPKQVLPFDGNEGAAFWWANSRNTFTNNVACENDRYGFRYEATQGSSFKVTLPVQQPDGTRQAVDIRTLPFIRFEGNESHSEGLYGFNLGEGVNRVGPDIHHPNVVRNTKIWNVHYAMRPQSPSMLIEDLKIWRAAYGIYHPNYENHVYRNIYIGETNTEPFNRGHDDLSVQFGVLTVDGLTFEGIRSGSSMPLIQISDDNPTGTAETHIRNLKVLKWTGDNKRAIVNLGGGPRPTPKTEKCVPIYIYDQFGAGRTAKIVSTKTKELKTDGLDYRAVSLLTGDESRVAEVKSVDFPKLLDPIDDLPPTTVITHVKRDGSKLMVRGTASDNGVVKSVTINGTSAKSTAANFSEWEVVLDAGKGELKLTSQATDDAGNIEKRPHVVTVSAE